MTAWADVAEALLLDWETAGALLALTVVVGVGCWLLWRER